MIHEITAEAFIAESHLPGARNFYANRGFLKGKVMFKKKPGFENETVPYDARVSGETDAVTVGKRRAVAGCARMMDTIFPSVEA